MDPKTLYVCQHCGKQMLELDKSNILKLIVDMMFSGYLENGVFILEGTCKECAIKQQIIFYSTMVESG
jgi:hypothetical protein